MTTELLGKAAIPNLPYEQPDGTPIRVNTDYFGKPRNEPIQRPARSRIPARAISSSKSGDLNQSGGGCGVQ